MFIHAEVLRNIRCSLHARSPNWLSFQTSKTFCSVSSSCHTGCQRDSATHVMCLRLLQLSQNMSLEKKRSRKWLRVASPLVIRQSECLRNGWRLFFIDLTGCHRLSAYWSARFELPYEKHWDFMTKKIGVTWHLTLKTPNHPLPEFHVLDSWKCAQSNLIWSILKRFDLESESMRLGP